MTQSVIETADQGSRAGSTMPVPRDSVLDLVKWLALITMVVDHLRYVLPSSDGLYLIGRFAFPFFCLAIAMNVARSRPAGPALVSLRYVGLLLAFSVLSEWPYRLLVPDTQTLNVMPTLALGALLAGAVHRPGKRNACVGACAIVVAGLGHEWLMYGLSGVLLPSAFLIALRSPLYGWVLPSVCCLAANLGPEITSGAAAGELFFLGVLGACFVAPLAGQTLVILQPRLSVVPVKKWAYIFYPAHFLILAAVSQL